MTFVENLDTLGVVDVSENGFDLAYAMYDMNDNYVGLLDPSYGQVVLY